MAVASNRFSRPWLGSVAVLAAASVSLFAQTAPGRPAQKPAPSTNSPSSAPAVTPPPDYVIGPDDILSVIVWREKDLSAEVAVRPDGKISLPLINDVQAAGLTPEQLRLRLTEAVGKLIEQPSVTVVVKEVRSRQVFVIGQVSKPGPYPLSAPTTVLQLLATAGGPLEYADTKNIRVTRAENGRQVSLRFNYKDVIEGKNLNQNIQLKPGDTIIVP